MSRSAGWKFVLTPRRVSLAASLALFVGLGSTTSVAWGNNVIDTAACPVSGYSSLSYPPEPSLGEPGYEEQLGNTFTAPGSKLKTFSAMLYAMGSQAVTLALYEANGSGPEGGPIWSQGATIAASPGGNFELQTFTVNAPVTPGNTYMFAIISGSATAEVNWAQELASNGGSCDVGPRYAGRAGESYSEDNYVDMSFMAEFNSAQANLPATVFSGQPAGTIGEMQTVTVSATETISLGIPEIAGANAGDFLIVADQCAEQTITSDTTCTIGLRFAPQTGASAARTASLSIPYTEGTAPPEGTANPATGTITGSLSGTAEAMQAGPEGPAGNEGAAGKEGAPGQEGKQGATGKEGDRGETGATGPQGATGKQGPPGNVRLITCERVQKQRTTKQLCKVTLGSNPIRFADEGHKLAATLTRAGVVYAKGFIVGYGTSSAQLLLTPRRKLTRGAYTLTIEHDGKRTREQVTLG